MGSDVCSAPSPENLEFFDQEMACFGVFCDARFNILAQQKAVQFLQCYPVITVLFSKRKYNFSDDHTIYEKFFLIIVVGPPELWAWCDSPVKPMVNMPLTDGQTGS